ncbi:hypothetical protein BC830DRAFT_1115791 [Chytriomyces sp. MP71]|nr:hypothetical protein BC830DRAFT_1115791 [Chytriomyces sp. MP71]
MNNRAPIPQSGVILLDRCILPADILRVATGLKPRQFFFRSQIISCALYDQRWGN